MPALLHHMQAEAKAAEASHKAQEYYHKLTNAWTPHWLDTRLEQASAA